MLRINSYSLYLDDKFLLEDINLSIEDGQWFFLIGESGSGKTLLSRAILDLLPSKFKEVGSIDRSGIKMDLILQQAKDSFQERVTIGRQFAHLLDSYGYPRTKHTKLIKDALEQVRLEVIPSLMKLYPQELSGGMCQKLAIAFSLLSDADLIIADEPTSALDSNSQGEIMEVFKNIYEARRQTFLFISHDLDLVREYASHVGVVDNGRLIETGTVEEVFERPIQSKTKELILYFEDV